MTTAAVVTSAVPGRAGWTGSAFGLAVRAQGPLLGVDALDDGLEPPGSVEVRREQAAALRDAIRGCAGTSLLDRRHPDGRTMLRIDRFENGGYLVAAPRHGRHLISLDGRVIRSAFLGVPEWHWQRLLFAQVLPLAATLQGLEVVHASAVVMEGRAYGFVAPSGTGKTSLAMNLAARGAELLTDDVLALDVSGHRIMAYAGGRLLSVAADELAALEPEVRHRLGTVLATPDKVLIRPNPGPTSAPLGALYFLRRNARRRGFVDIDGGTVPNSRLLLGARFITYLQEPEHLLSHLDLTARIAAEVPTFVIDVPGDRRAADVAAAVAAHAAGERSG